MVHDDILLERVANITSEVVQLHPYVPTLLIRVVYDPNDFSSHHRLHTLNQLIYQFLLMPQQRPL